MSQSYFFAPFNFFSRNHVANVCAHAPAPVHHFIVICPVVRSGTKELEKKVAEAELKKVKDEILTYANKDELANQVVTRTTADPEFRHFIVLTIRAITLMRTLEEENND